MDQRKSWDGVFQPGQQVGELTVVESRAMKVDGKTRVYVLCRCSCGNEKNIRAKLVTPAALQGFPCYRDSHSAKGAFRQEFITWTAMKQRCYNAKDPSYGRYGGRGIQVCDRWRSSFRNFLQDMGRRPKGRSLDRIDNSGDYEPGNCRWATAKEQATNRRGNRLVTCDGVTKTISGWCEVNGLRQGTVTERIRRGWTDQDAVTVPLKRRKVAP
jgi:hypothetical protein